MIVDINVSFVARNGDRGNPAQFRVTLNGDSVTQVYELMGKPHGDGVRGLELFLTNVLKSSLGSSDGLGGLLPTSLNISQVPGYEVEIEAKIIAKDERDFAPAEALPAYEYQQAYYDLGTIVENAETDENGRKWAYHSVICEFWATSLEQVDPCPNESCPAHCPHCGSPLIKTELQEYIGGLPPSPDVHAIALAAYALNSPNECHIFPSGYEGNLRRISERSKLESELRAKAQESGRYAHLVPDHEALADLTCPTCGETAVPVALKAQGEGKVTKWLLTWDCGHKHYALRDKRVAPWPFIEKYATPLDLQCAGFKVVE